MGHVTEEFRILGRVGDPIFATWALRHMARLGLQGRVLAQDAARMQMVLTGPPELLDAMEMGCSLGPREVWVERIERRVA